ncbi:MAG: 3-dehydroquinate synthase [Candidatus Omnitrophota bacterium]
MRRVSVSLKDRSYDIIIGWNLIGRSGALLDLKGIGKDVVIISNRKLLNLHGRKLKRSLVNKAFTVRLETVPDSERAKDASVAVDLIARIASYDRRKEISIIAFGGGVIGDLAGFVAAVYKRGVPFVQIPTTLLAQVDSAIGGKTAVDLSVAKNLVGAFYQPKIVLSDISLLRSLSRRQIRNGLAEVIKYGVIKDGGLFRFIESSHGKILRGERAALERIISRSSLIKARIVEEDEFDRKGSRALLNYGHTIGHAIEAASRYSGRYNHGEAVGLGMIAASRISMRLGKIDPESVMRIERLIKACGLPTTVKGLRFSDIYESQLHDKKFSGARNRFVLPVKIGRAVAVDNVPYRAIKEAVESMFSDR